MSFISYSAIRSESVHKKKKMRIDERNTKKNNQKKKLTFSFINQIEQISLIRSFQRANIIILRTLQHLGKTRQIHAKRHRSITTIAFKPIRKEFNSNKRDVRVIHSLQVDTFLIAFEIGVCN
jgi:hypothetical protein